MVKSKKLSEIQEVSDTRHFKTRKFAILNSLNIQKEKRDTNEKTENEVVVMYLNGNWQYHWRQCLCDNPDCD